MSIFNWASSWELKMWVIESASAWGWRNQQFIRSPIGTAPMLHALRTVLLEEWKTQTRSDSRKRQTSTATPAKPGFSQLNSSWCPMRLHECKVTMMRVVIASFNGHTALLNRAETHSTAIYEPEYGCCIQ